MLSRNRLIRFEAKSVITIRVYYSFGFLLCTSKNFLYSISG